MNDPYVAGARALKHALDAGLIDNKRYETMYAAIARAAEQDAVRCEVAGCAETALLGKRCARHFDRATLPAIVAGLRGRA